MYHLLKGLHEHLTRKDEFSVIIIGLDGAGKTVCKATVVSARSLTFPSRPSWRRSRRSTTTSPAFLRTRLPPPSDKIVQYYHPARVLIINAHPQPERSPSPPPSSNSGTSVASAASAPSGQSTTTTATPSSLSSMLKTARGSAKAGRSLVCAPAP